MSAMGRLFLDQRIQDMAFDDDWPPVVFDPFYDDYWISLFESPYADFNPDEVPAFGLRIDTST